MFDHRLATSWHVAPAAVLPAARRFRSTGTLGDLCRSEADDKEVRKKRHFVTAWGTVLVCVKKPAGAYIISRSSPGVFILINERN